MAIKYKTLYTTLQSGINTYTFTDDLITSRSKIAIWTDDDDVYPLDAEIVNTHSVAIAISDHINPVEVALVINNIEEFDPDAAAGVSKLSELTDVLVSSATNGQYLVYNGSKWINKTVTIPSATSDLSDIDYTGLDGGQVLMYNNVTSKWVNAFLDSSHIADSNYTNLKAATDKLVQVNTALNSKQDAITPSNKLDYSLLANTPNLALKQNVTDNSLETSNKTITGAINEVNAAVVNALKEVERLEIKANSSITRTYTNKNTLLVIARPDAVSTSAYGMWLLIMSSSGNNCTLIPISVGAALTGTTSGNTVTFSSTSGGIVRVLFYDIL